MMQKFVQSVEPTAVPASGVDEEAMAQASLSTEKDIKTLLKSGDNDETEDSVGRDRCNDKSCECRDQ